MILMKKQTHSSKKNSLKWKHPFEHLIASFDLSRNSPNLSNLFIENLVSHLPPHGPNSCENRSSLAATIFPNNPTTHTQPRNTLPTPFTTPSHVNSIATPYIQLVEYSSQGILFTLCTTWELFFCSRPKRPHSGTSRMPSLDQAPLQEWVLLQVIAIALVFSHQFHHMHIERWRLMSICSKQNNHHYAALSLRFAPHTTPPPTGLDVIPR